MKTFTTTGICVPEENYMVDITDRLYRIKAMVDAGQYFTINRARQFGKTTTLAGLARLLRNTCHVISLDFQNITDANFKTEERFVKAISRMLIKKGPKAGISEHILRVLDDYLNRKEDQATLDQLFDTLASWCREADRPVVMIIDEIDSATNNQVFLDFLALLRLQYLERKIDPDYKTFQSVILAGVTDIKNLKRKIRPEEEHKYNSPWNIASDFDIEMSFSATEIAGMLYEYEADHKSGMDVEQVSNEIYNWTGGYPFLVSRICLLLDMYLDGERFTDLSKRWTVEGVSEAVRRILIEKNTLFDSLLGKVYDNPDMSRILERILFAGDPVSYNPDMIQLADAEMYGFITNENGNVAIANRIFETRLYNYFLSNVKMLESPMFKAGANLKTSFIKEGRLQMEVLIRKFVEIFDELYSGAKDKFDEEEGRRRFLLFIRPIINGTGNYYVEAKTRRNGRMDLVVDYLGERFVIELKIWRGMVYHQKGEHQLAAYLNDYKLNKGYLLTYNFNKNKKADIKTAVIDGKTLIEAIV